MNAFQKTKLWPVLGFAALLSAGTAKADEPVCVGVQYDALVIVSALSEGMSASELKSEIPPAYGPAEHEQLKTLIDEVYALPYDSGADRIDWVNSVVARCREGGLLAY